MGKPSSISFQDDELLVTLPAATRVVHIDDTAAPWAAQLTGKKVDWAWEEPNTLYLCEIKDPEASGALKHPPGPPHQSHAGRIVRELGGASYGEMLAQKAINTLDKMPSINPHQLGVTYVVLLGISNPLFTSAEAQTASLQIERHLRALNKAIDRVVVATLQSWNDCLGPRSITRRRGPSQ